MRSASARACAPVVVVALAFLAAAGPAPAQTPGHSLDLSGPATATVGQPVVIQALGGYPPTDFFSSWLDVHAIPASVVSACPGGYLNSSQIAGSTYAQGGETIAIAQRANGDAAGRYAMPFAYTPRVAGRFLVCGYANDGAAWTHAMDALVLDVGAAGGGGSAPIRPTPVAPARITVSQSSTVSRRATRFRVLRVRGVPAGSRVVATCTHRGRRCPGRARRTLTVDGAAGTVPLAGFTRVALKPRTVLRITITTPGAGRVVTAVTIRSRRAPRTTTSTAA